MALDYTTTALLASIKRRAFLPAGTGLSNTDILAYATEELETYVVDFLKGIREEYIISTASAVVTNGRVRIPSRASGTAFRSLGIIEGDGRVRQLPRLELEVIGQFTGLTGTPIGYAFDGPNAILLPAPTSATIQVKCQLRPGKLVATSECAVITSVSGSTATVTATPANITSSSFCDITAGTPGFEVFGVELDVSSVGSTSVIFTSAIATTLLWPSPTGGNPVSAATGAPGCIISAFGESCIPQVPWETHRLLAQATAVAILRAQGSQRLSAAEDGLKRLRDEVHMVLSPRDDGSVRRLVSGSRVGRWYWGW